MTKNTIFTKPKNLDAFIAAGVMPTAPAAPVTTSQSVRKLPRRVGNKLIISVSLSPQVVESVDDWASARGMSRAAALSYAVSQLVSA